MIVRLPGMRRELDVKCRSAPVARALEAKLRTAAELGIVEAVPPERIERWFERQLEEIDAAHWQAEKRVRGSRIPRWGIRW